MRIVYLINICIAFLLISSGAFSQTVSADSISSYFYTQSYVFPQEKIYAHLDRPDYLINDTIWFRAYLVNAQTHIPDPESNFVYRSEEHTSELQSRPHLVCRLLLEKKKN